MLAYQYIYIYIGRLQIFDTLNDYSSIVPSEQCGVVHPSAIRLDYEDDNSLTVYVTEFADADAGTPATFRIISVTNDYELESDNCYFTEVAIDDSFPHGVAVEPESKDAYIVDTIYPEICITRYFRDEE